VVYSIKTIVGVISTRLELCKRCVDTAFGVYWSDNFKICFIFVGDTMTMEFYGMVVGAVLIKQLECY
jgi:hypothetical protein